MSAVFFQDAIGLLTFGEQVSSLQGLRPRIGKNQVIHCLDAYQRGHGLQDVRHTASLSAAIGGFMRKTSMVPVVSDFLFEGTADVLRELARLNACTTCASCSWMRQTPSRCRACRPDGSKRSTSRRAARA